jgi:uncharacterized protein YggE
METNYKQYAFLAGSVAGVALALLALTMSVTEYKSWKHTNGQLPTITVSGEGEVTAVPDIATVTFTVRETKKTVPEAQKATEAKVKVALDAIKKLGVAEKDIKTLSYTVNPKYESQGSACAWNMPCPPTKTVLVGYDVANTIQVKVRKVDTAGDVLGAIGTANITEVSGPEFTVDDMEKVQADAKEKAIKNAKDKAKATAEALGVSLGAISQYNEDGGYTPMFYKAEMSVMSAGVARDAVSVPQGESVIKARVTITYTLD